MAQKGSFFKNFEPIICVPYAYPVIGGVKYVFDPPTLTEDFFEKKAAAGEKFLGSLFSKIWRFLEKNSKN